jgi:hypothetical protein
MILNGHTPVIAARDSAIGGIHRTQLMTPHPVKVFPIATTAATDKNVMRVADTFLFSLVNINFSTKKEEVTLLKIFIKQQEQESYSSHMRELSLE